MGGYFVRVSIFILVCAMIIVLSKPQSTRSSFGEYCNGTVKCNKSAWLVCKSSSCSCFMEDMIYEKGQGKCVAKSGERCKFQVSSSQNTTDLFGVVLYETMDCVPNAVCDVYGLACACKEGYYETHDGYCHEQKNVNLPCKSTAECKASKGLICVKGQCLCDPVLDHVYDNIYNPAKCVGKAGKVLKGNTTCVTAATLNKNNVCSCLAPETKYAGESGFCYVRKTFGEKCTMDDECAHPTQCETCVQGQCACDPENLTRRTLSPVVTRCVGKAGKPCNTFRECVANAVCSTNSSCVCNAGYSVTAQGFCGIGHGQSCVPMTPCGDAFRCTNGICNCPQLQHQTTGGSPIKCLGLFSSFCSNTSDCFTDLDCKYVSETGQMQCVCKDGLVENEAGKCVSRAWNSTCIYGSTMLCDPVAGLVCRNGLCSCPDTLMTYDFHRRACVGLVGSRCDLVKNPESCGHGGKCVQLNKKVAGRCLCEEGFEVKGDATCGEEVLT